MREQLAQALKTALKAKDQRTLSTVRLILAALKDRDIAARTRGPGEGITDDEILALLQSMIKQRHESIALYEQGGRLELAKQEAEEIEVIKRFLPVQMEEADQANAVDDTIADLKAESLKDMGRVMAALKERYAGRMDFAKASALVKTRLA
ncbi:MAG: GatB/YqeY domain-containing protein [Proteobacteria bacterium]|nr:GatB/YqeY domain-containing protein [Pseudomonadota bacterium]